MEKQLIKSKLSCLLLTCCFLLLSTCITNGIEDKTEEITCTFQAAIEGSQITFNNVSRSYYSNTDLLIHAAHDTNLVDRGLFEYHHAFLLNLNLKNYPQILSNKKITFSDLIEDKKFFKFTSMLETEGRDVIVSYYRHIISPEFTFEITRFDTLAGVIEGEFSLDFAIRIGEGVKRFLPDTVRVRNASFNIKLRPWSALLDSAVIPCRIPEPK